MTQPESELVTWKNVDKDESGRDYRHAFYLAGMRGTVQFIFMRMHHKGLPEVMPADLGYHSPVPLYEGQRMMGEAGQCDALRGPLRSAPCYYDGSGLAADPVYKAYQTGGDDAVWQILRDYYFDRFYDGDYDAGYEGLPYRTPEESHAALMEGMREILAVSPDPEAQKILDQYDARKAI